MGRAVALTAAVAILASVIGFRDRVIGSMLYYPEPGVAITPERLAELYAGPTAVVDHRHGDRR